MGLFIIMYVTLQFVQSVKKSFQFSSAKVSYHFNSSFSELDKLVPDGRGVVITDEHVFSAHKKKIANWQTIVIKPGEAYKTQATVDRIINELIELGADRKTVLVGVGGGVVTDITGYVAGIYMRGIRFGFVPTSLLAMVDASIGGKNGIDAGVYKNMIGLIRQPSFLLFDASLLKSLPKAEWQNGFAEIIKHACIKDAVMFKQLAQGSLSFFQKNTDILKALIQRNALLKTKVVLNDEFEQGERKLLNFGHTLGHAIENMYGLSHGHAISTGMAYASLLSEELTGFKQTNILLPVLAKYGLPGLQPLDAEKAFLILRKDKKKDGNHISYILLKKIGKAVTHSLPFDELENRLSNRISTV